MFADRAYLAQRARSKSNSVALTPKQAKSVTEQYVGIIFCFIFVGVATASFVRVRPINSINTKKLSMIYGMALQGIGMLLFIYLEFLNNPTHFILWASTARFVIGLVTFCFLLHLFYYFLSKFDFSLF